MCSEAAAAAAAAGDIVPGRGSTTPLHFVVVPLMAQGHMIPMVDLARLLAARGVLVTFITTPVNFARIRPIADRAAASALPIRFVQLTFPVADAGLPHGCESIDLVTSTDHFLPFMNALQLLREPLSAYLRSASDDSDHWPRPSCIVSDNLHHWTADVARALDIPRIIFHGPSCFFLLCSLLIERNRAELEAAIAEAESAGGPAATTLPGLPQPPIRISKHQVINARRSSPGWSKILDTIREAEDAADGVLVNSFAELEPCYLERFREEIKKPVWAIGPLSLYKEESEAKAARGRVSSMDNTVLFRWLDAQEAGSVVFVSFGSIARNTAGQVMELGHGLEASGRPFVWAVKEVAEARRREEEAAAPAAMLEEWLSELEKRVEGRGVVIRGWAPQALILGHAATGMFLTHCGWNSVLESVAAGVVMATWPHFADQFLNERFVVDVMGIGAAVGIDEPTIVVGVVADQHGTSSSAAEEEAAAKVRREDVERVVEELMRGGGGGGREEEAEQRRQRARDLAEKATRAMDEAQAGSSCHALNDAIHFVSNWAGKKHIRGPTIFDTWQADEDAKELATIA
ncbi:UDP-glycosyltransferase 73C6 [Platanthera zijinensis]|uniref:UDP-glycosyltransferase 73C6 n=1 Tax=Platanthera zijinensis TaxID=2320716 RepID=A0AAP0AU58_9ASPA